MQSHAPSVCAPSDASEDGSDTRAAPERGSPPGRRRHRRRVERLRAATLATIADSIDIDLIPRFATWGFRALLDLTVIEDDDDARATVHLRKVVEHREALAHTSTAVDRGLAELRAAGHVAVIAAVVEGRGGER